MSREKDGVRLAPDHPHLHALNSVITSRALSCASGVFTVDKGDLVLYYGREGPHTSGLGRVDFSDHTVDEVKRLAECCEPASFGRGGQDVLDEAYRKAWKLDQGDFSATFDAINTGLVDEFKTAFLEGHGSDHVLRLELHKLNVYGPGSFFKAHKDTPRGYDMLGSLVVVYPTRHVGGALKFCHQGQELTFDSSEFLSTSPEPSIAYAAFYGDVEHEVSPVESGYRVTLTYNLYLIEGRISYAPIADDTLQDHALQATLRALLLDPQYLPDGGLVGFGLRHEYAITPWWDIQQISWWDVKETDEEYKIRSLQPLLRVMKGSDAVLVRTCKALRLSISVRMVVRESNDILLLDEIPCMEGASHEDWVFSTMCERGHAKVIGEPHNCGYDATVYWATEIQPIHVKDGAMCTPFVAYGNDAFLACAYSRLCLIVEIGDAQSRRVLVDFPMAAK